MKFRLYSREKDEPVLREMLAREKIPYAFMQHDNPILDTWVMEDVGRVLGFYSWNTQHGRAALIHFIVNQGERKNELARELARHFVRTIKKRKLKGIIVAIPESNPDLVKFVKYYFENVRPYAIQDNLLFLKAEV